MSELAKPAAPQLAQTAHSSALQLGALHLVLILAMSLPMLILYAIGTLGPLLIKDLHIAPAYLGYASMSSFAIAALLSLVAGSIVERIGTKTGLVLLFGIVALSYLLIISLPGLSGVLVALALCGVAQGLCNPITNLLIAQQIAPAKKAAAVGLKQAGVQIGALFAGLLLPSVALHHGWRFAIGMLIPVALLLALLSFVLLPSQQASPSQPTQPSPAKPKPWSLARPNALLWRLMGVQACVGIVLATFVTFLPVFAASQGVPITQAGWMIAAFGAMGILSRVLLTPLAARLHDETALLLALLLVSAGMIAVTMQANPGQQWLLWLAATGMGLTAVATNAIAMGMLLRSPSNASSGGFGNVANASGLLSAAFFGGFAFGPAIGGAITVHSFTLLWQSLLGVLLLACIIACSLLRARASIKHTAKGNAP